MAGQRFYLWIGQHENGRYSKAHRHGSSAILICAKGKGYTYTWPETLGMTPWKDGHGDKVLRQDYEEGGMVSAAPLSGDWYHQHFGTGSGPLRLTAWFGPNNHDGMKAGFPESNSAISGRGISTRVEKLSLTGLKIRSSAPNTKLSSRSTVQNPAWKTRSITRMRDVRIHFSSPTAQALAPRKRVAKRNSCQLIQRKPCLFSR